MTDHDRRRGDDWDPVEAWRVAIRLAEVGGDTERANRLRAGGPPPGNGVDRRAFAPVILSVEVGGDPGGAIAVALAALELPLLSLVVVIGGPEAARFTRYLLNLLGRRDVMVVASAAPPSQPASAITGLTPTETPPPESNVQGAVRAVTALTRSLVLWGNCGPLTDLAVALADDADLPGRLFVAIASGPLDATPDGAATSVGPFAADPGAATAALATVREVAYDVRDPRSAEGPSFPPSLISPDPDAVSVDSGSPLHRGLTGPGLPPWAALLGKHMDQWFEQGNNASLQYGALTVADLRHIPIIEWADRPIVADASGHVRVDPTGTVMATTAALRVWLVGFTDWLDDHLRKAMLTPRP